MKIEKISDKQIRCTLNYSDLHSRELSIRELAYGSEKARGLFHEMITMAANEVGFVADDAPLMIEAIPLASDGIMLVITKIEDPDELDTRFSRFAPSMDSIPSDNGEGGREFTGSASELLESLKNMIQGVLEEPVPVCDENKTADAIESVKTAAISEEDAPASSAPRTTPVDITSIYIFRTLDEILRAAKVLKGIYNGHNTLFKSAKDHSYYLILHKSDHTPEDFNKICNILTEYAQRRKGHVGTEAYYFEHLEVMIDDYALQRLAGE